MDTLRKRIPYSIDSDAKIDPLEDDKHIMDEQEQDELIEDLKKQTMKSDIQFLRLVQAVVAFIALLHVLFFFAPDSTNPLFTSIPSTQSAVIARVLIILQLFVHLNLMIFLIPQQEWIREIKSLPLSMTANLLLSVIAPVYSVLSFHSWQRVAWWGTTLLGVLLVHLRFRWMEEGKESIAALERLKYNAKGA